MDDEIIKRYARRLRLGVLIVFGAVLALVICGQFGIRIAGAPVILQPRSAGVEGIPTVGDGVLVLLAIAIYWLSAALRAIAGGDLFSRAVVRSFRQFAVWMLVMALFTAVAPMILATAAPMHGGRHRIMVLIDLRELLLVGLTLLLLLIARMFERARAIQDEMSEIV
ncbi:hypothetical protein [Sphingomonas sp.]|uniref:hypothetical protein n=1 Tax=Sphingomonas sp. TaxID=28214 RepID=UPI0038ABBFCF